MKISLATKDRKYLQPIPGALAYLRASLLADGRLARYYELKTNRPLYMNRRGKTYTLTYDDSNFPPTTAGNGTRVSTNSPAAISRCGRRMTSLSVRDSRPRNRPLSQVRCVASSPISTARAAGSALMTERD